MTEQLEVFREFYTSFKQMSLTVLSDVLHPDVVHVTRPNSINVPERNKSQILEHYEKMFSNWVAVENVCEIIADTPGKIVSHITGEVALKSGPTVTYESFITVEIAEDPSGNKKIKYIEEFMDANAFSQVFAPYMTAKA